MSVIKIEMDLTDGQDQEDDDDGKDDHDQLSSATGTGSTATAKAEETVPEENLNIYEYDCQSCKVTFNRKINFEIHLKKVHNIIRKICVLCKSEFVSKCELDAHKESEHLIPNMKGPVKCGFCPVTIGNREHLVDHMKVVHLGYKKKSNIKSDRFKCTFEGCSLNWPSKAGLKRHEKNHLNQRDYNCSLCGRSFVREDALARHVRRHTTEKPYKCPIEDCPARFERKDIIGHHIWAKHPEKSKDQRLEITGTGTVPCPLCAKPFFRAGLESHMRVHTKERPFPCHLCPYRSKEEGALRVHLQLVHSDERPFQCGFCDKKFKELGRRNQHQRMVHSPGGDLTRCKVCYRKYVRESTLILHYNNVHQIDLNVKLQVVKLPIIQS